MIFSIATVYSISVDYISMMLCLCYANDIRYIFNSLTSYDTGLQNDRLLNHECFTIYYMKDHEATHTQITMLCKYVKVHKQPKQVETDRAFTYARRSTYGTSIDVRYLLYFCCYAIYQYFSKQ